MRIPVSHHSSVIILEEGIKNNFLFHLYDNTYPRVSMRERANLIGGNFNPEKKTNSPMGLLRQELIEEFSTEQEENSVMEANLVDVVGDGPGAPKVARFAPKSDIALLLRTSIMNAIPYKDFVYHIPALDGKAALDSLTSVFYSSIPHDVFERARENLSKGLGIRNEGLTIIASADELVSGKVQTAWGTGEIMGRYLGRELPNSYGVKIDEVGRPTEDFTKYAERFDYKKPVV